MTEPVEIDRLLLLSQPEIAAWLGLSEAELRRLAQVAETEEDDEPPNGP